jgi:hypothetical protein
MPLWAAALLFSALTVGFASAIRAYARGGGTGKFPLAAGIILAVICLAAALYIGAVFLLVSSVE